MNRLPAARHVINTGCGKLYVHISYQDEKIYEVFLVMGKAGVCANAQNETIGRLVSLLLTDPRVKIEDIIHELKGITCGQFTDTTKSCADGVAQVLQEEVDSASARDSKHIDG